MYTKSRGVSKIICAKMWAKWTSTASKDKTIYCEPCALYFGSAVCILHWPFTSNVIHQRIMSDLWGNAIQFALPNNTIHTTKIAYVQSSIRQITGWDYENLCMTMCQWLYVLTTMLGWQGDIGSAWSEKCIMVISNRNWITDLVIWFIKCLQTYRGYIEC